MKLSLGLAPPSPQYAKVDGRYDEEEDFDLSFSWFSWTGALIVLFTAFVSGVIGFSAGRLSRPSDKSPSATSYLCEPNSPNPLSPLPPRLDGSNWAQLLTAAQQRLRVTSG